MNKSTKIVRTKTTYGSMKKPNEMYYDVDFMTFSKYIGKMNPEYTFKDYKFELYPYKWYDLRWIYQIPSYWILLRVMRMKESQITKRKHNIASTISLITEMFFIIKSIIELIKLTK